jgi:hypothetical protein
VSDELRIDRVERALREAQPPLETPGRLRDVARAAALGGQRRRRRPMAVALGLAAVVAAAAALAVGISLSGGGGGEAGPYTISLSGSGGAAGSVAVSEVDGGLRQVSIRLVHMRPARADGWYEMWYSGSEGNWKIASFDVPASGSVELHTTIPADASWTRCWVSLKAPSAQPTRVLASS